MNKQNSQKDDFSAKQDKKKESKPKDGTSPIPEVPPNERANFLRSILHFLKKIISKLSPDRTIENKGGNKV